MRARPLTSLLLGSAIALAVVIVPAPPAGATSASARTTSIRWSSCATPQMTDFECGTLTVPRDWGDSSVGSFDLAVARHRSSGSAAERIGSLFFNPGGPGGSGLEALTPVWEVLPESVKRRFDVVTWDPRGVGSTVPAIDCDLAEWQLPPATGDVDWEAFTAGVRSEVAAVNAACLARYPDVAPYVGTNNVVRDLEALRVAVGDTKLSYWGASYGTRIGYVYALTYPGRFRALLLDGPVSPRGSIEGFASGYSTAADLGVGFLFQNYPGTKWRYQRILGALQQEPLMLSPTRAYTQWDLGLGLEANASSQENMPEVARYLRQLERALFGAPAQQRQAKAYLRAFPVEPVNAMSGLPAMINCLDYPDRLDESRINALGAAIRFNAPITGWIRAVQIPASCEGLDALTPQPVPLVEGSNWSARMLILAATRDAQTPYIWGTAMANAFRSSPMVSYVGNQHVTFGAAQSPCVNRYATQFLIGGRLPATDVACDNAAAR